TMFYFLLMLPLGILYFTIAITGISVGLGLIVGSIASLLLDAGVGSGGINIDNGIYFGPSPALAPLIFIAGVLLLTGVMHLVRGIGRAHGTLAKHLLVAPRGAD
ncbi:MAG: hypothetical protein WBO00_08925, partial [Steroidobacteraceae bacterium]